MIVRLGDQILFDPGKTELKKDGEDALRQVTDVLKEIPNRNFQVAGHTDNIPIKSKRFRSNWDLSTARAVEVVNFMIASGMEPKRLSAAGYADQSPVAGNDTTENKAKNRRIEITLVPNLDDLPPIDEALKESPVAEPAADAARAEQELARADRRPWTPRRSPSRGTRSPGRPRRPACAPRPSCAAARSCGWSSSAPTSSSPTGARAGTPGWCSKARWS